MTMVSPDTLHELAKSDSAFNKNLTYWAGNADIGKLQRADADGSPLRLDGVDHTARPTWKLRETIEFYRDILGLPLIHTISARGWGQENHPDFLHFFFDAGKGATIAFFYYIGTDRPSRYEPEDHWFYNSNHTAWSVPTEAELQRWKAVLEARGLNISPYIRHEVIESIYFTDPNGYPLEITLKLRETDVLDATDASLTLQAAMDLEDELSAKGERLQSIDDVWRRKAKLVEDMIRDS